MKILFGIQGTGNGHLSRAKEIIPHLEKYGTVDLYVSGTQAEVQLAYPILYKKYGWSFIFGQKGGVDIMKTFKSFRPRQLLKDTFNCPVKDYDLIINDYEPITAWACRLRGIPCYGLSHQGAYLSEKSPRPTKVEQSGEYMLKHFSPTTETQAFHFARYDDFINTPVIRSEIRALAPICKDHIAVYLPAVGDDFLISIFSKIKMLQWKVFSKRAKKKYIQNNVEIHPVSGVEWEKALDEARAQIKEVISELTGGLSNDLRTVLVDAFVAGEDAAIKMGDTVAKVLENILSNLIFNSVFSKAFDDLEKEMAASFDVAGDGTWIDDFSRFFNEASGLTDDFNAAMAAAQTEAANFGFDVFTPEEATAQQGLQGAIRRELTEETGSELTGLFRGQYDITRRLLEATEVYHEKERLHHAQLLGLIAVNTKIETHTANTVIELKAAVKELEKIAENTDKIYLQDV